MENARKEIDLESVKSLMDREYQLIYVDRNENLDDRPEVFARCIEERSADHLHDYFDKCYLDQQARNVDRAMAELKKRLVGAGYKYWETEKLFEENEDAIRDEIYSRATFDDVTDLLRNTRDIAVRVEMYSDHDCINSHWFESQSGFSYESSYFGDMIDALGLNPHKIKRLLTSHGEKVRGHFPNRKSREGRELVSYEQFYEELINSSCAANLLTFVATVNPVQIYEAGFDLSRLTIPKGNKCGLFSSTYGGGSLLEMELLHDVTIDLRRSDYPNYGLQVEVSGKGYGYSVDQVYGVTHNFFGQPIEIDPLKIAA